MSEIVKKYNKSLKESFSGDRVSFQMRAAGTIKRLFEDSLGLKFEGKFLDIGCGDGSFVRALQGMGNCEAQGIDIDSGVDFERDLFTFEEKTFDIGLLYAVIEHIVNPNNLLKESHRIIKRDQHLIVITPNIDTAGPGFYNDPTHVRPYNAVSLEKLMRMYGFEKTFVGLWTVGKSNLFWKLPTRLQFKIGVCLPFSGSQKFAPLFLKGKSVTILGVFKKV